MGIGVAAIMRWLQQLVKAPGMQRTVVYASSVLAFLPVIALAGNYHACDRTGNFLPKVYAQNLLDNCAPNAILFTAGDNDTFPVWCLQEAYNYRRDVRVVNLSLLNTDWYVAQMKNRFGVPISLTDEQILWHPYQLPGGPMTNRPSKPFADRPRGRMTYMHQNFARITVQNLMVDEIVIENKWESPIYFSSPPYAESPLKLREHAVHDGQLYRLERDPKGVMVDVDHSYELFMNVFSYQGMENAEVVRDDNATGVFAGLGMSSLRVFDELLRQGDRERAEALMVHLTEVFPEFWQSYASLTEIYLGEGDTAKAVATYQKMHDTLAYFLEKDPGNQAYMQDFGTAQYNLGKLTGDPEMIDNGIRQLRRGFEVDKNSPLAYMKMSNALAIEERMVELIEVTRMHGAYKRNLSNPRVQSILSVGSGGF
jgi:hypothetical protein